MVFAGSPSSCQPGGYGCCWRRSMPFSPTCLPAVLRHATTGKTSSSAGNRNPADAARRLGTGPRYLLGDFPGISDSVGNAEQPAPGSIGSTEECTAWSVRKPGAPGAGNARVRSGISSYSLGTNPGRLHVAPGADGLRTVLCAGKFHEAVDPRLEAWAGTSRGQMEECLIRRRWRRSSGGSWT